MNRTHKSGYAQIRKMIMSDMTKKRTNIEKRALSYNQNPYDNPQNNRENMNKWS